MPFLTLHSPPSGTRNGQRWAGNETIQPVTSEGLGLLLWKVYCTWHRCLVLSLHSCAQGTSKCMFPSSTSTPVCNRLWLIHFNTPAYALNSMLLACSDLLEQGAWGARPYVSFLKSLLSVCEFARGLGKQHTIGPHRYEGLYHGHDVAQGVAEENLAARCV